MSLRTLRTSRPSSIMCLKGPICTSRISSFLMTDSAITYGMSSLKCPRMSSGLCELQS